MARPRFPLASFVVITMDLCLRFDREVEHIVVYGYIVNHHCVVFFLSFFQEIKLVDYTK